MPVGQLRVWHVYPDAVLLQQRAVEAIGRLAAEAIAARGAFHIVLAGGNTPRAIYQLMRGLDADWSAWHVYFGDERCLPVTHAERNSVMARQAWLGQVAIPAEQIHAIPGELGSDEAARRYVATLDGVDDFDLVLLGLGEDGHTASLFPGRVLGEEGASPSVLAVDDAPKPPAQRVSLSAWRLGRARQVWFMVTGAAKGEAVKAWHRGDGIPAAAIRPTAGVDVFIEACCYWGEGHE